MPPPMHSGFWTWMPADGKPNPRQGKRLPSLPSISHPLCTLLVQQDHSTVAELDAQGKLRWALTGLSNNLCNTQVLPGSQRVLVVEANRVTERDVHGKILWQKEGLPGVASVQWLRKWQLLDPLQRTEHATRSGPQGQEVMGPDATQRRLECNVS